LRRADGRWFLYFSAAVRGRVAPNGRALKCIGVASSSRAAGPFVVVRERDAAPLLCQPTLGGDIDPSPFRRADGASYLVTKTDGNSVPRPTTLQNRRLSENLWSFAPGTPTTLLGSGAAPWERGVVEGPDLVDLGGRLHLLFSGGDFASASYGEGQALCAATNRLCVRNGRLLDSPTFGGGAGGASAFEAGTGGAVLAWHAYVTANSSRRSLLLGTLSASPSGGLLVGGLPAAGPAAAAPRLTTGAPVPVELTVPAGQPVTVPNARARP
jgi:hypothetical protein